MSWRVAIKIISAICGECPTDGASAQDSKQIKLIGRLRKSFSDEAIHVDMCQVQPSTGSKSFQCVLLGFIESLRVKSQSSTSCNGRSGSDVTTRRAIQLAPRISEVNAHLARLIWNVTVSSNTPRTQANIVETEFLPLVIFHAFSVALTDSLICVTERGYRIA